MKDLNFSSRPVSFLFTCPSHNQVTWKIRESKRWAEEGSLTPAAVEATVQEVLSLPVAAILPLALSRPAWLHLPPLCLWPGLAGIFTCFSPMTRPLFL